MCGRFSQAGDTGLLRQRLKIDFEDEVFRPRFNIAPTQTVPVILLQGDHCVLQPLRWGLIPPWAREISIGSKMINARWETAATKPAFRSAFRRSRCVIPADGFFEWTSLQGRKQPHWFHRKDGEWLWMAGLWESWSPPPQDRLGELPLDDLPKTPATPLSTFSILTTAAGDWMAPYHHRMPVLLETEHVESWILDRELPAGPAPPGLSGDWIHVHAVSSRINSPTWEDPSCLEPLA